MRKSQSCLCLFEPSALISPQVEKESAPKVQEGSCRESRISAVMVARLVNHLVPSLQGGDPFFVPAFLCIYQRFATTQQVLDMLFKRYAHLRLFCEEDEQIKKTICTFLDTWMDKKPEEFCQSSALTIVKQMKNFLVVNMPYSDLTVRVRMLLTHLEEEEATGSEAKNEEASGKNTNVDYKLSSLQEELSARRNTRPQSQQEKEIWRKDSFNLKFASQGEKTLVNAQLPYGNMENSRTERQQYLEKLDVTHPEMCPWAEIEEKTLNELQEALEMLKAADTMCRRIQRIELENSNLIVATEKQAKEMEALWGKVLSAGINVVEAAPRGDPGKRRRADAATLWSQAELMKLVSELSKMRMQDDSCKMEVEKYKELYLKELRSNNALLSLLPSRTCKCPEGSSANLEEEMRWNTSAMVAIVGARPECPQVAAYLTSSSMESQGHVSRPSQSPEVSREFMENPKSQSEDKEKARERLVDSVHALIRALRREARRTGVLQKKLAKMKKILNMPPKEGHGFDDRRHCFHEVSKVSEAKMSIPVATISLEGEAAAKENLGCVQENPSAAVLTRMESEMKDIKSAISEVSAQEHAVKKELKTLKHLYRGELEHIDGMSQELRVVPQALEGDGIDVLFGTEPSTISSSQHSVDQSCCTADLRPALTTESYPSTASLDKDLLELMKVLVLWIGTCRISMTRGSQGLSQRSFGKDALLMVYQKPEALNKTNNSWQ
ncbi:Ras guanine nucleotide exchange factor containing protein [Cricetulus griseus]|uniref:Ras guanine nucleotide exchange factor containing protein n=1 Tax=Cricetulus griseus TaxID=10029 RepID=A0A061IA85_CRIGR|nr:Ras guanine nucleotide exchange factor containing protein [Cricetulus griseus]